MPGSTAKSATTGSHPPGVSAGGAGRIEWRTQAGTDARGRGRNQAGDTKGHAMLRHLMIGLAAVTLVSATLIPDVASAASGRHAGDARVAGARTHASHPIARNHARGYALRRGAGAATVGAAAAGAATYPNSPRTLQYQGQYGYGPGAATVGAGATTYRNTYPNSPRTLQYQGQFGPYRGNY